MTDVTVGEARSEDGPEAIPTVAVHAERNERTGVWLLRWAARCPFCGARDHVHGGGDGPEADYGSRGRHCPSEHRAFREDCIPARTTGGRTRCTLNHGHDLVELVPVVEGTDL